MADNEENNEENTTGDAEEIADIGGSGLGNLPPLSDFDSQGDMDSDSGLPPLGNFESDESLNTPTEGALPPISEITSDQAAPDFGSPPTESFSSGDMGDAGFQDLAADSDFSPETPEIGPGPSSNADTPTFDSAFGGGEGGFDASVDTPAPTQSMETPMFGGGDAMPGADADGGFEQGAFGAQNAFDAGTPAPDFSPDTDLKQISGAAGALTSDGSRPKAGKKGLFVAALFALVIGIVAGPFVSENLPFLRLPNNALDALQDAEESVTNLQRDLSIEQGKVIKLKAQVAEIIKVDPDAPIPISIDDLARMTSESIQLTADIQDKTITLDDIEIDIADRTIEFIDLEVQYQKLDQQNLIATARQNGLLAENQRLTTQNGQLGEANDRRLATKDALGHSIDRLYITIKEGLPLTPQKYSHDARLAKVADLRDTVRRAKWVTPALQDAYVDLMLNELEIATAREFFFAKIIVTDKIGVQTDRWAECLMIGNTSVIYHTLDGNYTGRFERIKNAAVSVWTTREDLADALKNEFRAEIAAARTPNYDESAAILIAREKAAEQGTKFQRAFSSL